MRGPWLAGALLLLAAPTAMAENAAPICGRADIVGFVGHTLAGVRPYEQIIPDAIYEFPTSDHAELACVATTTIHEFNAAAYSRLTWLSSVRYHVHLLSNGFRVALEP
jgi:hypothetical protein